MRLKLKELKSVVDATRKEINNDNTAMLREEIVRAFGPVVDVGHTLETVAENVNNRLDVLEKTGRRGIVSLKTATLRKMSCHKDPEVRRVAARMLPESDMKIFVGDPDLYVRHAAAERMSSSLIREMLQRTPRDPVLRDMFMKKRLHEQSEEKKERLGDAVKQQDYPDLTDQNYVSLAKVAISDYNHNVEGQWDEPWASRYSAAVKATTGVDVDRDKLWKEIQKQLEERDDAIVENSLKETVLSLRDSSEEETLLEAASLLASSSRTKSSREYLKEFNQLYGVRSRGGIPVICSAPHGGEITTIDESAADAYVSKWNSLNSVATLRWQPDTRVAGRILFNIAKRNP